MNSGSSAPIGSAGQSAGCARVSWSHQTSRPSSQSMVAPVRRTTITVSTRSHWAAAASTLALSGIFLPPRRPSSAVMTRCDWLSMMRSRRALGREAAEHHRMHRADAGAGEQRHRRLRDHRHVDGDPVALGHSLGFERVGQAAHRLVQLAIGQAAGLGRIVALPDDRGLVAAGLEMPVEAVLGDVEHAVLEPLDRDRQVEGGVLDAGEGPDPIDPLRLLAPETVGVGDRLGIERAIAGFVDQRARRGVRGHGENLVLIAHLARPVGACRRHSPCFQQFRSLTESRQAGLEQGG